jgi:hypothetical protein
VEVLRGKSSIPSGYLTVRHGSHGPFIDGLPIKNGDFQGFFPGFLRKELEDNCFESWDSTIKICGIFSAHHQRLCLNKWEGHPPLKTRAENRAD